MPINLEEIDKLITQYENQSNEFRKHADNLKFIREKILSGSVDERRIIELSSKLTIDSLNATIKAITDSVKLY